MKILASDFDNTLYVESTDVFHNNINSINKFIRQGNIFCIVTGRCYTDIKILLDKYSISYNYLICEDGAKIFNNMGYAIYTRLLPSNKVSSIEKIIPDNYEYFLDDGYNKTQNINDCVRIAIKYDNEEEALKLLEKIQKEVLIFGYLSSSHINITDLDVNKKNALKLLCNLEKLDISNLYVIGDDINDLEMIKEFSGVVMSKHTDSLDNLNLDYYDSLNKYIEELSNN